MYYLQLTFGIVVLLLAFWLTLVTLQAHIHFVLIWFHKIRPKYWVWGLIRSTGAALYALPFSAIGWREWVPIFVFQATSHYVIFNPTLNRLRSIADPLMEYGFWYLGSDSGWFDKFFLKYQIMHRVFYYACFLLMVLSGFLIIERYA